MWKIGIWAERIMWAAILVVQWQGDNFFQVEKFEISRFQTVHGVMKNAISPKVFNRFSKTFLLLRDMENRDLGWKFLGAAILVLQLQGENFFQVEKFEISHFQAWTPCQQKCYITKGIQLIFKNFPSAEGRGK